MKNGMEQNVGATAYYQPDGKEADVKYPQDFMHSPNPNKPGKSNNAAKVVNAAKVMMQVMDAK